MKKIRTSLKAVSDTKIEGFIVLCTVLFDLGKVNFQGDVRNGPVIHANGIFVKLSAPGIFIVTVSTKETDRLIPALQDSPHVRWSTQERSLSQEGLV